jgi:hypothetical protein
MDEKGGIKWSRLGGWGEKTGFPINPAEKPFKTVSYSNLRKDIYKSSMFSRRVNTRHSAGLNYNLYKTLFSGEQKRSDDTLKPESCPYLFS